MYVQYFKWFFYCSTMSHNHGLLQDVLFLNPHWTDAWLWIAVTCPIVSMWPNRTTCLASTAKDGQDRGTNPSFYPESSRANLDSWTLCLSQPCCSGAGIIWMFVQHSMFAQLNIIVLQASNLNEDQVAV